MQQGRVDKQTALEAQKSLEKAIQLNPQFAPAFEGLSQAYEQHSASGNVGGEEGFPGGHLARGW